MEALLLSPAMARGLDVCYLCLVGGLIVPQRLILSVVKGITA